MYTFINIYEYGKRLQEMMLLFIKSKRLDPQKGDSPHSGDKQMQLPFDVYH